MALAPGSKVGAYDVVAPIGAGGMGEVYRARDSRLGRDVAIKILPAVFAEDRERLARFEREARTLAALNHPNIATIHGIEAAEGSLALVMELVEGEDLSTLISEAESLGSRPRDSEARQARGGGAPRGMSLEDSLRIARQIADALEAAHEAGITHRDLKPANIKVRPDGTVKLLDFGLATTPVADATGASTGAMNSPTLTARATAAGMILGTAAYMSPEQARGKPVDRRADIWAFGCVLFEMLSGQRPFKGEDISETLAAVIKDEPAWSALPADLPEHVRRMLRRCLEKDPKRRLSAIGDARLELDEPLATPAHPAPAATAPAPRRRFSSFASAVAVLAAAITTAWALWFRAPPPAPLMRLTVLSPQGQILFRDPVNVALSPDGRKLAFITGMTRQASRLWVRSLDRLEATAVEDSTGAQLPFWSPDSEMVGFFAAGTLKVASVSGGRPQVLADAPDGRGGTWSANGDIVFSPSNAGPLLRVSQNGGAASAATELRAADGETGHRFPTFLPDGDHFLLATLPSRSGQFGIDVASLSSKDRVRLLTAEGSPVYAEPGFLFYTRNGVLVAHPFDAAARRLTGEAVPIADTPGEMNLEYSAGLAASASRTGALAYLSAGQTRSRLAWLDQAGREVGAVDAPLRPYAGVALSRDGTKAIVTEVASPKSSLSLVDLARGGITPVVGFDAWSFNAIWAPDGRRFVFGSDRKGPTDLYVRNLGEAEDRVLHESADLFKWPMSWSVDGTSILFTILSPRTNDDLWLIRPGSGKPPEPVLQTPANDAYGVLSPDGRWLAYISDKAGAFDVYVQAFPAGGDTQRITTTGSMNWGLWWKRDGSQLMILDANLKILLVDVRTSPTLTVSAPREVGQLRFPLTSTFTVDAMPDLSRLLALVPEQIDGARSMTVVLNWRHAIGK